MELKGDAWIPDEHSRVVFIPVQNYTGSDGKEYIKGMSYDLLVSRYFLPSEGKMTISFHILDTQQ